VPQGPAAALASAGAVIDIALGIAVTVRASAGAALMAMLVVTCGYVLAASVFLPSLWLDPLGALAKTVPVALSCLFTLAILDER